MGIATQRYFVPDNDLHDEIWEFWWAFGLDLR
jgi:hypothetical protein